MKKLITIFLIGFSCGAFAQDSLKTFNSSRVKITTTGMEVLGGWAVANISTGAYGWSTATGTNKYFYKMNTLWNVANLGAAVLGFTGVQSNKNKVLNAAETLQAQKKIEKTFLINGGLDVIYIGAGAFIRHRGDTHNNNEQRGYGSAIILQGAFLLLFDGSMYNAERHNGNKLRRFLEKNPISFDGKRVGMIIHI